jgi:uncharacterized protein YodC (DUF2158 family)
MFNKEMKMATTIYGNKFKPGDKVNVNGNNEAVVLGYYSTRMVECRLWSGFRHVGDVCVDEIDIKPRDEAKE